VRHIILLCLPDTNLQPIAPLVAVRYRALRRQRSELDP